MTKKLYCRDKAITQLQYCNKARKPSGLQRPPDDNEFINTDVDRLST